MWNLHIVFCPIHPKNKDTFKLFCVAYIWEILCTVSCQFLELRRCLSHRDAKIVMSPGIDFVVQKYTAMGHIKFIIQTTHVRDDIM